MRPAAEQNNGPRNHRWSTPMYPRILVPMDGSDTASRGLVEAIRLAHGHPSELVLLHVIDDFPTMRQFASNEPLDAQRAQRRAAAQELLAHGVKLAQASRVKATTEVCFAIESAPDSIIETAGRTGCGLIVIGTHGRSGVRRAVLGSVAEAVSRRSVVPVLLVPPHPAAA
jgi:nucleotide-binding universal stress UspA family protein